MEHGQIGISPNFPANKQSTKAIHPRMGALAHPAARLFSSAPLQPVALFAARTNVSGEVEFIRQVSDLVSRSLCRGRDSVGLWALVRVGQLGCFRASPAPF